MERYQLRQKSKGTIIYKMVSYTSNGARINLKFGDILLDIDYHTDLLWVLERQEVR